MIFYSFWYLISSECKVDGAAGDGTKQGTCTDAGQTCKADGICGAYQYYYFYKNILHYLISYFVVILIFSACHADGSAGDGTKQGTCTDAGQKCKADGTCGTYFYHWYL